MLVVSVAFFTIMLERCIVFGCNNTASSEKGISLYHIPYWCDNQNEAKSRRKKRLDFVTSQKTALNTVLTLLKDITPKLRRDEIGITAVPSVLSTTACIDSERTLHMQRRGKLCNL